MFIAKAKKHPPIGVELMKLGALLMVRRILSEEAKKKLAQVPLSNSTIQRRMTGISGGIEEQFINEVKGALFGLFAIQLDKSADVA